MFSQPALLNQPALTVPTQPLNWLTQFGAVPDEALPPFELNRLQPPVRTGIVAGEWLEVTIWDLQEPGIPATFPVRVSPRDEIELPHVGTLAVGGRSGAQLEHDLSEAYRLGEWLQQPRILIRERAGTPLRVYVTGAVARPGVVELSRREASVFAALISAGGLTREAGRHLYVSSEPVPSVAESALATDSSIGQKPASVAESPSTVAEPQSRLESLLSVVDDTDRSEESIPTEQQSEPAVRANSIQPQSVPASELEVPPPPPENSSSETPTQLETGIVTRPDVPQPAVPPEPSVDRAGQWYDLTNETDLAALRSLAIHEGMTITVKQAAPPVRVTGAVNEPGAFSLAGDLATPLSEVLQRAAGLSRPDAPVIILLTRPATSDRALQRWTVRLQPQQSLPENLPTIQPGDLIHVETTAKAKVQRAIGGLWPAR